jgi:polysaccharide biosynthesis protein PslH
MKIFVLLSRVPYPLDKGDKLRAFHQIKELSKKHKIILCALSDEQIHEDAAQILKKYCEHVELIKLDYYRIPYNVIKAFFLGKPLQVGFFYNEEIKKKIDFLIHLHKPDHIYCQLLRMAEYVESHTIPKTLDYMDAFSKGAERRMGSAGILLKPILAIESQRLKKYEAEVFDRFENRTIISIQDRDLILHKERQKIKIIPNGVDADYFSPSNKGAEYDLLFTGNMNYPPNIEAAEYLVKEILPEVRKQLPETTVLISGADPSASVMKLESFGVKVTGRVEDIRDSYSNAKIFTAPMRIGTGLQNKLLEAMAMGKACITSELANNALEARTDDEIIVAKTTQEYAKAIVNLLGDENKRTRIAENGRLFVLNRYNWTVSGAMLEEIISGKTL